MLTHEETKLTLETLLPGNIASQSQTEKVFSAAHRSLPDRTLMVGIERMPFFDNWVRQGP